MTSRPFHIVCAVDLSEFAPSVIENALDEAHRHAEVVLHFITVLEPGKGLITHKAPTVAQLEEAELQVRSLVAEALPAFADDGPNAKRRILFHARAGKPEEQIVELAFEARAERIVLGRHGSHIRRDGMGTVASRVVSTAPCTVYVVQPSHYEDAQEDYESCAKCVAVRESSGGQAWFCPEHSEGRVPRLSESVGVSSHTPGWGVF